MPRGDRTGPMGMGPMTGRAAGFCAGNGVPGFSNATGGRGRGFGCGQGRGFGRGRKSGWGFQDIPVVAYSAPRSQVDELSALKNQSRYFGEALDAVNRRIAEIEPESR